MPQKKPTHTSKTVQNTIDKRTHYHNSLERIVTN